MWTLAVQGLYINVCECVCQREGEGGKEGRERGEGKRGGGKKNVSPCKYGVLANITWLAGWSYAHMYR